ncbi:hypothetical protein PR202_gb26068 [Eleusine coracana subsp. coracana]|uniref:Uncharacterized protein n=1 Tax=Eleusine coracana subsp. coracana TaxID=191504 RepID=A0AAV5FQL4_ELECO|nr:hypothetical protein PR202_gb26068 [Eleusine coracana subsp. coracana]
MEAIAIGVGPNSLDELLPDLPPPRPEKLKNDHAAILPSQELLTREQTLLEVREFDQHGGKQEDECWGGKLGRRDKICPLHGRIRRGGGHGSGPAAGI